MSDGWDQFGLDYDHDLFEGAPQTYLIASTPRSGSHFLGHLLLATGALGSPLEYFHPAHIKRWMASLGVNDFASMMRHLHRRRTSSSGWFGVKAHWPHFAPIAGDAAAFRFVNVAKYIEIRRRDRIAQAISGVIAQQTQAWISFHTSDREPVYDFSSIHAAITGLNLQISRWHQFFHERGITPLVIEYEDLAVAPDAFVDRILADFNVGRSNAPQERWRPKRQASDINRTWQEQYLNDLSIRSI